MRTGSLIPLEPERARNARLWPSATGERTAADPGITHVSAVTNAARIEDVKGVAPVGVQVRPDAIAAMRRPEPAEVDGPAAPDVGSPAHRIEVLRRALARGDTAEQIREAHPTWWAGGSDSAAEKRWQRDRRAAEARTASHRTTYHLTPAAHAALNASENHMPRQTKDQVEARREALRKALPASTRTLDEVLARFYDDLDKSVMLYDLRAIGAVRASGGEWSLPSSSTPKAAKAKSAQVGPIRPSLADEAIRCLVEGAGGPGVELPAEYCRALLERVQ